jgi:phage virion morphogenesis protein
MAGSNITVIVDELDSPAKIARLDAALSEPKALLRELGEYLLGSTKDRFKSQLAPDGTGWQALTPRYLKRKHRNKDKILTLRGHLRSQIAYQLEGDATVAVGSALKYAAIHQHGGEISRQARQAEIFRKQNKAGKLSRLFSKKKAKGAVATRVTIGAHTIKIPARPFLGLSDADRGELQARTQDFLRGLLG